MTAGKFLERQLNPREIPTGGLTSNVSVTAGTTLSFNRSAGTLLKNGAGTLSLGSQTGFTGNTVVAAGELRTLPGSARPPAAGATLTGSGRVGNLDVEGLLSAAAGAGTLTADSATFAGGSSYFWEMSDAVGAPGTGNDSFSTTGGLTLNANADNKMTIFLASLGADGQTGGLVYDFDAGVNHSYLLMAANGGINGFIPNAFSIDASGRNFGGASSSWSVTSTGTALDLNYTAAVPEPGRGVMFMTGLAGIGITARCRRNAACKVA